MIDPARLARPYARAAFEYAQEHQQLPAWSAMLQTLAERVSQPLVLTALRNPNYTSQVCGEIGLALGEGVLDTAGQNLVKLLAAYHRLALLPAISTLFEQLRAAAEQTLQVQVSSAVSLSTSQIAALTARLHKKLGQPVVLQCEIDPSLLAGLLMRIGDQVIDSSVRGQLQRLGEEMAG